MRLERGSLITVFGGSGFVGRHVVRALARRGYRIRAACRRPDLAGHLQPMGTPGQIHAVQANVRYPESVATAIRGASAVVNLVGLLDESGRQRFESVHVGGAKAIADAARSQDVNSLVQISAIGADLNSPSAYGRTKAQAENAILESFPGAVILRPSIVFGPEDEFFNRFAEMARISPVLPLIGGGKTRFQPVYVGDVAEAVVGSLEGEARGGTIYELGGPEILTFRQLMEAVLEYTDRHRVLLPLPFWLAKLVALLLSPLPSRPITVDQVRLLQVDNVVSKKAIEERRTLEALGVTAPKAIALIVPAYLERFHPRGQYAHYRG